MVKELKFLIMKLHVFVAIPFQDIMEICMDRQSSVQFGDSSVIWKRKQSFQQSFQDH